MCSLWNHMLLYSCLILPLTHVIVNGITLTCDETYRAENGHQCYPCSAGYHKVSDCMIDGEQSRCMPCGLGHYMPSCDNATKCEPCRSFCPRRQVKVKNCTSTNDMECQCKPGFFWIDYEVGPYHGHCKAHQECKVGEGLVAEGTPFADTKCMSCENGMTYSNSSSYEFCKPCSTCNTSVLTVCTVNQDTVCRQLGTKQQNDGSGSSNSLESGIIAVIVVASVTLLLIVAIALAFILGRYKQTWTAEYEKALNQNLSLDQNLPVYQNANEKDDACEGTSEEETDSFSKPEYSYNINKAFHAGSVENLETDNTENRNDETSNSTSNQLLSDCSNNGELGGDLDNKTDNKPDEFYLLPTANLANQLNTGIEKEEKQSKEMNLTNNIYGDNLSQDTDLTIDVMPVSPRFCPNEEMDEPGIHNQPEDIRLADIEVEIPSQTLVEETERSQLDSEQEVRDSFDSNDILSVEMDLCRPKENHLLTVWFEIIDFLQCRMSLKDFRLFVRRLANITNKEFHKTLDVKLANLREENTPCNETIYQLLMNWQEATPKAQPKDVFNALKYYNFNNLCTDLINMLKDKNFLNLIDEWLCTHLTECKSDTSHYSQGELSEHETKSFSDYTEINEDEHSCQDIEILKSYTDEQNGAELFHAREEHLSVSVY